MMWKAVLFSLVVHLGIAYVFFEKRFRMVANSDAPSVFVLSEVNVVSNRAEDEGSGPVATTQKPTTPVQGLSWALLHPAPEYPEAARREKREGQVYLRIKTKADGFVDVAEILKSSGDEELDLSAKEAVSRWRLYPNAVIEQPITFKLSAR